VLQASVGMKVGWMVGVSVGGWVGLLVGLLGNHLLWDFWVLKDNINDFIRLF
jgi:hypothetical protein